MATPSLFPSANDAQVAEMPGVVSVRGWKNITICIWTGQGTGPAAELVKTTIDRPQAQGALQSYVHVINNQLPLPDAEARAIFMSLMKERANDLACIAIVVLGSGFWASAMRNAVIGMRVFAPRTFDFRVFGTCEEVVDWLPYAHEQRTGVSVSPDALARWLGVSHARTGSEG